MRFPSRMPLALAIMAFTVFCCGCSNPFGDSAKATVATTGVVSGGAAPIPNIVDSPPLGNCAPVEPGVCRHEVTLQRNGVPMKVWIYLPGGVAGKLPCVLIAPAGTHLIDGMKLAAGDSKEHIPYVRAGFAVVSYEIDGAWPEPRPSPQVQITSAKSFKEARGGLANASAALDYALAKVSTIDSQKIYVAGHSSAATLALLIASKDPRIKGCVAFAPATDVEARVGGNVIRQLNDAIPGFAEFMKDSSPTWHINDLHCPVFLFHAIDDNVVSVIDSRKFVSELKKSNSQVTYVEFPRGGHYDAMIAAGIPQAIGWLKKLAN